MSMSEDLRFDKRVVERNLQKGVVSEEDHQKYLKSLKDSTGESATVEATLVPLDKVIPSSPMGEEDDEF